MPLQIKLQRHFCFLNYVMGFGIHGIFVVSLACALGKLNELLYKRSKAFAIEWNKVDLRRYFF